jgi:hypothetical protein
MNLQLFIRNKLIGSIPLDSKSCSDPHYIISMQKELEEKFEPVLKQLDGVPTFYLQDPLDTEEEREQS